MDQQLIDQIIQFAGYLASAVIGWLTRFLQKRKEVKIGEDVIKRTQNKI